MPEPDVTSDARFYAGWAQSGRERGEQIMLLSWRLPEERIEALVFLLNWRGDGLKDFYRTREMTDAEWDELVEHNGQKGAPLVAVTLAEGRGLLEAALAESTRFSRPLPREYRLTQRLVEQRLLAGAAPASRSFVSPELTPEAVVAFSILARHHRDYALAAELLAPQHPERQGRRLDETANALRAQAKGAPRRDSEAQLTRLNPSPDASAVTGDDPRAADAVRAGEEAHDEEALIEAESIERAIEPSGRRTRHPLRERYTLRQTPDGWRITRIERL